MFPTDDDRALYERYGKAQTRLWTAYMSGRHGAATRDRINHRMYCLAMMMDRLAAR